MFTGLLPIGTVVLLKDSTKRVMIIGLCQKDDQEGDIWDYSGCIYPEGYIGPNQVYLFNNSQIDRVYAVGYQDEEQFAFKEKADQIMVELRGGE